MNDNTSNSNAFGHDGLTALKFFVKNYGCQMNIYDSEKMSQILFGAGFQLAQNIKDANLVILNTCFIREKAEDKLFSDLGRIKEFKNDATQNNKIFLIATVGCVSQARGETIQKRAPYVDIVIGPQEVHKILEAVNFCLDSRNDENANQNNKNATRKNENLAQNQNLYTEKNQPISKNIFIELQNTGKFSNTQTNPAQTNPIQNQPPHNQPQHNQLQQNRPENSNKNVSQFLTIQEGCNNFCTYCVVPFTRGSEYSRAVQDVLNEAKNLVSKGVKEIVLLGQNVNSYHGEYKNGKNAKLSDLLYGMAQIEGLKRIKYSTSNPKDMSDDLIQAHKNIDILMPILHLPVQSGSDAVLKKMNRKYTIDIYKSVIDKLYENIPDMAITSDFIVGFPGESEEDFRATIEIVNYVKYAQAYSFKYSPRPLTPAKIMSEQIEECVKQERLAILQDLLMKYQNLYNQNTLGKNVNVLLEKNGSKTGQLGGRTQFGQAIVINDCKDCDIGDIVQTRVEAVLSHSLVGGGRSD